MGLIGGMARTAVVAGTATAVSNRVSRRQANRWADQAEPAQPAPQQPAPPPPPQQQAYAQPVYVQAAPAPAAPAASQADVLQQLQDLGQLKAAGVLTEEEFNIQKAKILAG